VAFLEKGEEGATWEPFDRNAHRGEEVSGV